MQSGAFDGTSHGGGRGSNRTLRQAALCSQNHGGAALYPPAAIFALGYWAGLRISEIATLHLDQCIINQRAGSITLVDAKGGKTRTLDLHNMARRALYDYLYPATPAALERDPESMYVFTSQRSAWLQQHGRSDHLSERGIEHLWA